jgi:hypothetical protein
VRHPLRHVTYIEGGLYRFTISKALVSNFE